MKQNRSRSIWRFIVAVLLLVGTEARCEVSLTTIHHFGSATNGFTPNAGLTAGRDGNLYGTTQYGGAHAAGTIFKVTTNRALTTLYSFTGGADGGNPVVRLCEGPDGNFYGKSANGGVGHGGTIFKITPAGILSTLYSFTNERDGMAPASGLVLGDDGNFYGTTGRGGISNYGTFFRITPAGKMAFLYSFRDLTDGVYPEATLVKGGDGNFYGSASMAGDTNGSGTVFKITPGGVLTTLHVFKDSAEGGIPSAPLVDAGNGSLYGTIGNVGKSGTAVFKITAASGVVTSYPFPGPGQVGHSGGLTLGDNGWFYGEASGDGKIVFKMTTDGQMTFLHPLDENVGELPIDGLVRGADGNFYGVTFEGGGHDGGAVFRTTPAGGLVTVCSFDRRSEGVYPAANLVDGRDGYFYGVTTSALVDGSGTVFRVNPSGAPITIYSFKGTSDGADPTCLVWGGGGVFFGTTSNGGKHDDGGVFKITTAGVLTPLYSFTGGVDGRMPSGIIRGRDGNFYGTAAMGGINQDGALFKITPAGEFTPLHAFTFGPDGGLPCAGLAEGADGNFYGAAAVGGANREGTIFRITPAGKYETVYSFIQGQPDSGLMAGTDGNFYGTICHGGANDFGGVYRITPAGTLTMLHSFTENRTDRPASMTFLEADDGGFFGTSERGGNGGMGTIVRVLDASGTLPNRAAEGLVRQVNFELEMGSTNLTVLAGVVVDSAPTKTGRRRRAFLLNP